MADAPLRVLLVEDDEDYFFLTRDLLADIEGKAFELEWAPTYEAGLEAALGRRHDVYLVDHRLGAQTGLDLLRQVRAAGVEAPVIFMTAHRNRETDIQAMQAGASDFLVKSQLDAETLERSIRYALERQRAEEALKKAREELEHRVVERTAELSRANAMLAEADRRKNVFLAMLAHELRNPLAPLLTGLHVLGQVKDPAVLERTRAMLERQVRHLARLVDDLLDVARITRGVIELRKETVDLAAAVGHAVETARPALEARRHRLEIRLPDGPVTLQADPLRLEQVLANLLGNAAKFTEPGGRILLTAAVEGPEVVFRVRDTGRGIAPELLPQVFDLFIQADRSLDRKEGGLGVGLTLVRSVVELHGGRVEAHSEGPGKGSEFVVRLPREAPAAAAAEQPPATPAESGGPPRSVLVVDDNVDAAESLAMLLRLLGQEVEVAHDGPTALAAAAARPPQLVFLDIGMPGMDGYEVARRLRQLPGGQAFHLVALTGWGQPEDRRSSEETGFDRHLVKPVETGALEQILNHPGRSAGGK